MYEVRTIATYFIPMGRNNILDAKAGKFSCNRSETNAFIFCYSIQKKIDEMKKEINPEEILKSNIFKKPNKNCVTRTS